MLPVVGRWLKTTVYVILSSQHFPLHHSSPREFSHSCCPSQRIFPPSAIQTLLSLSGNNLSWLVLLANLSKQLIGCPWFPSSLHIKLCITWSIFVVVDGHKRWPTSRHFVGIEIQRDCNFEAQVYHFGLFSHLDYSINLWCSLLVTPSCLLISVASYTEIFRALSYRQAQIQDYGQQ